MSYLLVSTDGFSISHKSFSAYEEAYKEMEKRYKDFDQSEFDDFYKDQSMIGANSAAVYNNGDGVYLWEIIDVSPSEDDKDNIYNQMWEKNVFEDVKSYSTSEGIKLSDEQASEVAHLYVSGKYDCNEGYWTNIQTLINEVTGRA